MVQGKKRLDKNYISIAATEIYLGRNVTNFFEKRNINYVSIIIDYKNNSIIFWGEKGITQKLNSIIDYKKKGIRIKHSNRITTSLIKSKNIKHIVNLMLNTKYLAKPLNNHSVIIENVELNKRVILSTKIYFDFEKKIIILGNVDIGNNLKSEDLIRKQIIPVNEYVHNDKATVSVSEPKVE